MKGKVRLGIKPKLIFPPSQNSILNNDYIIFINQLGLGTCISWKGLILRRNVRNPYYLQTKATF